MRQIIIAAIAIIITACTMDGGDDPSTERECSVIEDCYTGEACALGVCHDLGCSWGVEVCCVDDGAGGSVCTGHPWDDSSGSGFTPSWTHYHPDLSPNEAWFDEYDHIVCSARVCRR